MLWCCICGCHFVFLIFSSNMNSLHTCILYLWSYSVFYHDLIFYLQSFHICAQTTRNSSLSSICIIYLLIFSLFCGFVDQCFLTSVNDVMCLPWLVGLYVGRITQKVTMNLCEIFRRGRPWKKKQFGDDLTSDPEFNSAGF